MGKSQPSAPLLYTDVFDFGLEIRGKIESVRAELLRKSTSYIYEWNDVIDGHAVERKHRERTSLPADLELSRRCGAACWAMTGRADRVQDQVYRRRWQLSLPKPCRPVRRAAARSLRHTSQGATSFRGRVGHTPVVSTGGYAVCTITGMYQYLMAAPSLHNATPLNVPPQVMEHIEIKRDSFEPYMEDDESFDDYLGRMRGDAEWGGHQELVAASQLYKVQSCRSK